MSYRSRYLNDSACGASVTCLDASVDTLGARCSTHLQQQTACASLPKATQLNLLFGPLWASPPAGPEYGVVGTPDGAFNNFNTLIRSSALDRTVMTARSFLDAVFPSINQPSDTAYLPDGQQARRRKQHGKGGTEHSGVHGNPGQDGRNICWRVALACPQPPVGSPSGMQVVPVYSKPDDGDALTRAYTACPAYDKRLLSW